MTTAAGAESEHTGPTEPLRRRRAPSTTRRENGATRTQILDAAIEAINELGYYRGASSNEIARRAGVTWGVIQHYFGARKALLMAVLENEMDKAIALVASADVAGDTVDERIECVARMLYAFYAGPGFNAVLQIVSDLSSDPDSEPSLLETLERFQRQYFVLTTGLMGRVTPGKPQPVGVDIFTIGSVAGLAVIEKTLGLSTRRSPGRGRPTPSPTAPALDLLIKALKGLLAD